jgi:diguanylate cyclase (GGDEF)-like protein
MKIIIADDDRMCRLVLRRSLQKLGHEVVEAIDGEAAWDVFQQTEAEVVISDWMMPGLSGVELCQRIRGVADRPYTYFVLLTSKNDKDSVLVGLEHGADDYLTKPLDPAEMQARLLSASRVTELHRELARLNRELHLEGRRDPLTRVGNRRRLMEDLDRLTSEGSSFCVALCDVDHFKKYNDTCGHSMGDRGLEIVAEVLATGSGDPESVYRYGGEEFLVVVPESDLEQARALMERCRRGLRNRAITHPAIDGVVTMSTGVAMYQPGASDGVEAVIERADRALYRAKAAGRDMVCVDAAASLKSVG